MCVGGGGWGGERERERVYYSVITKGIKTV